MTCSAEFPTSVLCFKVWSPLQRIDQGKRTRVLKKVFLSYSTPSFFSLALFAKDYTAVVSTLVFFLQFSYFGTACFLLVAFLWRNFGFKDSFSVKASIVFSSNISDFFHGFELWNFELKFILYLGLTIWIMFQSCWIFDQKDILDAL